MYRGFNVAPDLPPGLSPCVSCVLMASLLLSPAHVTHVRCGGSSLCHPCAVWGQLTVSQLGPEGGPGHKMAASVNTYHQPGQPNPITPTTYKLPRLSNSRVPTHPSSLSSSSERSRVDFDPIVSVFVKGGDCDPEVSLLGSTWPK